MSTPTFEEVACGSGESELRYTFEEFCTLPLSDRVALLLQKPRFYRGGQLLNGADAMSFRA
ncbi:hypothetical protein ENSA5_41720 [Enhygromyxa salina]|uniref:Uncharacterized protein n=1 Tax=Enhygromyxa salina TaxID=215803 RepID=A0A2S9XMV5_9BACT|nr:hypothetical protein [Enhygromyxa salina]PRP94060.1 hypothetical protein ENSA5_41720 [Enhygromyxa salina]